MARPLVTSVKVRAFSVLFHTIENIIATVFVVVSLRSFLPQIRKIRGKGGVIKEQYDLIVNIDLVCSGN